MMRKKIAFILCLTIVVAAGFLVYLQHTHLGIMPSKPMIQPYSYSKSEENLMNAFAPNEYRQIFSFQAPKETRSIRLYSNTLQKDRTWKRDFLGAISAIEGDDKKKGLLVIRDLDRTLPHINLMLYQRETVTFNESDEKLTKEGQGFGYGFLDNAKTIELNKEIPMAIIAYGDANDLPLPPLEFYDHPDAPIGDAQIKVITVCFSNKDQ